uniref:Uncharacterized protein n=1 Tax=Oryza meridionalis TaxID=40149 RepID=A0A0E0C299_9ORYZ
MRSTRRSQFYEGKRWKHERFEPLAGINNMGVQPKVMGVVAHMWKIGCYFVREERLSSLLSIESNGMSFGAFYQRQMQVEDILCEQTG